MPPDTLSLSESSGLSSRSQEFVVHSMRLEPLDGESLPGMLVAGMELHLLCGMVRRLYQAGFLVSAHDHRAAGTRSGP